VAKFLFANNAQTTLAADVASGDTTIAVSPGTGDEFPTPGAGEQFAVTFLDALTGLVTEIAYCTSRTDDTLTVVRAQEGTIAKDWSAGDTVANFCTAGQMAAMLQLADLGGPVAFWAAGGSANALTITPAPPYTAYTAGMMLFVQIASNNSGAATINVNGLGAKAIVDQAGAALTANQLVAGRIVGLGYTGTAFRLETAPPISSFISTAPAIGTVTNAEKVPMDDGSGTIKSGTVAQLAATINAENLFLAYFLGGY
jgi:hypothetical protein